ncbi:MAG: putative oxidoreductase YjmC [Paenibacillaceae bacterium]|jgi:LDH2 family malate/lactate/ureidoglycolate dehydrogenase|nr:putative oxidoreductase YjmC [Paenibacillaceae bacterium]
MSSNQSVTVDPLKLASLARSLFRQAGLNEEHAGLVAQNLCQAELRGIYSHGVSKVKPYIHSIENSTYNPYPVISVLRESGSTALLDGDFAPGAVSGTAAMELCLNKAAESGFACAAVTKGRHFGMAAFYAMMALERGMIGIALCNSGKIMAPYGGTSRVLGTNPICIAVPSGKEFPFVFDAATSEAAFNKIIVAGLEGRSIPTGWALDKEGQHTSDAKAALEGMVIPFGGYKGSGLGIMVHVLSGILGHAAVGGLYDSARDGNGDAGGVGYFFCALDVGRFQPLGDFTRQVDDFIDEIKGARRQTPVQEIYVPGELEHIRRARHLAHGVELGLAVYGELEETALRLGVAFDITKNTREETEAHAGRTAL